MGKSYGEVYEALENMKISFIATVFNEADNLDKFLSSLLVQTLLPREVVIVDGDSTDGTYEILKDYSDKFTQLGISYQPLIKKGNRAVGRNEAIRSAKGDVIVCSDAGCILDKNWAKNIVKPFSNSNIDVVAGYYRGKYKTVFQKCLISYVLVMPDKVNPDKFLPATRSMAFRKSVWKKVVGFPEQFSHNEDFVFAKRIKAGGANIFFEKDAIVEWIPPESFRDAFKMFYRFAFGDAEAKILRSKVYLIFLRYILGILLLFYVIMKKDVILGLILFALMFLYIMSAVVKNYKYVRDLKAIIILPILQVVSDIAVIIGTVTGLLKIWDTKKT